MGSHLHGSRGRLIAETQRKTALDLIKEAVQNGARLTLACKELGISRRTHDRWQDQRKRTGNLIDRRTLQKDPSIAQKRRLSPEERQAVLSVCNSEEFASKPPSQIVPILAEREEYICSESTMYRILKQEGQNQRRGRSHKRDRPSKPPEVKATGPKQCLSWDITYLPAQVNGMFFKLYMIIDVFSRKIVGWEVHDRECGEYAAELLRRTHLREGIAGRESVLHSDNGAPMKAQTMLAMMDKLNVTASFSRPSVSNDNPFSESVFKTLKYVPMYPEKPFEKIEQARRWVHQFVSWYNSEHRHSALRYVTPNEKHSGQDGSILKKRHDVYLNARSKNPLRWSGNTRNWSPVTEVILNPANTDEYKLVEEVQKVS